MNLCSNSSAQTLYSEYATHHAGKCASLREQFERKLDVWGCTPLSCTQFGVVEVTAPYSILNMQLLLFKPKTEI